MNANKIKYKGFPYTNQFKITDEPLSHETIYADIKDCVEISKDGTVFTLDREYVGYPSFYCKGKGRIMVTYGERLIETFPENFSKAWWEPIVNEYSIDSDDFKKISIPFRRSCKFIKITLVDGNVWVKDFEFDSVHAKIEQEGYFNCSDEKLNKIYEICKHTTKLCMQDYFEDGVKRDGLLWLGDARVQFLCNYALFAQNELVKKSIKYFTMSIDKKGRANVNAIPAGAYIHPEKVEYMFRMKNNDGTFNYCPKGFYLTGLGYYLNYAVDYMAMLYEYYLYSGDKKFVEEIYPFAKIVANRICKVDGVNTDGNFIVRAVRRVRKVIWKIKGKNVDNLHGKLFPRMTQEHTDYVDGMVDKGSYFAYLTAGLQNHLNICKIMGDKKEQEKTLFYINKFTKETKKYMDKDGFVIRKVEGDKEAVCTFTGLSGAYLGGIIDSETFKKNFTALINGKRKSAYPMNGMAKFWLIHSAYKSGEPQLALDFIRKEWGILVDRGFSTCVENWIAEHIEDAEQGINYSCCHGWSAGPCVTLINMLGVIPVESGYKKVKIQPQLCDLDFIEGAVPTPYGLIKVRADKNGVEYQLPDGVSIAE